MLKDGIFRDYMCETMNHKAMDEKNGSLVVNRAHNQIGIDLNSCENDFVMKIDGNYQRNGEPDANTLQNELAINGGIEMGLSTSQATHERRIEGLTGRWGLVSVKAVNVCIHVMFLNLDMSLERF